MTTASASEQTRPTYARFAIGFDQRDRARLHALIDEVLDSNRWSEATMTARFEAAWEAWNEVPAVALSSWAGGALAALHFAGRRRARRSCARRTRSWRRRWRRSARARRSSSSTATARTSACRSPTSRPRPSGSSPRGVPGPHRRPHRVRLEQIADYCREHGIFLIEDCAHAHGASGTAARPGTYGDAGVYSLYATKTISTGEGGVLVSRRPEVIEHAAASATTASPPTTCTASTSG